MQSENIDFTEILSNILESKIQYFREINRQPNCFHGIWPNSHDCTRFSMIQLMIQMAWVAFQIFGSFLFGYQYIV